MSARLSRETLLPLLAGHVLETGLEGLTLRPLARAAGTSDRMLLYHFGTKDALVTALLSYLAETYAGALDDAFPDVRASSRRDLAETVLAVTGRPDFAPFIRLWWQIVSGAARGNSAYRDSAGAMVDILLDWLTAHVPATDPDPAAAARKILTVVEGAIMLESIGRGDIAGDAVASLNE